MIPTSDTDLVIFSCEGRAQLMHQTVNSFEQSCFYDFDRRILALDGQTDAQVIQQARPDTVVQNYRRSGYISNILNALDVVDAKFFFWLEDDWRFARPVNMERLLELLKNHPRWAQVRLSKRTLTRAEREQEELEEGVFESLNSFSANPCLCRTAPVKAAFEALESAVHSDSVPEQLADVPFEKFITHWCNNHSFTCVVIDPGDSPDVRHNGQLERTDRSMHKPTSLSETARMDSGTKGEELTVNQELPSLPGRCAMLFKLFRATARVGLRLFWSWNAYLVAFRMSIIDEENL